MNKFLSYALLIIGLTVGFAQSLPGIPNNKAPSDIVNVLESDTDDNINTGVITFTPNTPALPNALYVKTSGVYSSAWRWTGTAYDRVAPRAKELSTTLANQLNNNIIPASATGVYSRIGIVQTTANVSLTFAASSTPTIAGQRITVSNIGTVPFALLSRDLAVGSSLDFEWNTNTNLWNPVGPGLITRAVVICAGKTGQSLTLATVTQLLNWTELTDTTNSFNPVAGIFTAPRAGFYTWSGGDSIFAGINAQYGLTVLKNGVQTYGGDFSRNAQNVAIPTAASSTVQLNAGDTLALAALTGATTIDQVSPLVSFFTIAETGY